MGLHAVHAYSLPAIQETLVVCKQLYHQKETKNFPVYIAGIMNVVQDEFPVPFPYFLSSCTIFSSNVAQTFSSELLTIKHLPNPTPNVNKLSSLFDTQ